MSRPSEPVVTWRATAPVPGREVAWDALQAGWFHYARLVRLIVTGKDAATGQRRAPGVR